MGVKYSEKQSIFAFGRHQTDLQTEVAIADDTFRWITKEGYAKAAFDSPNVANEGESTGLSFPDETYKDKDTTSFSANEQLTYQLLGIRAYDAFGVAATPSVVETAAAWLHTFSLLDVFTGATLPSRPLASKIAEPAISGNKIYDARLPGMTYQRFTISNGGDKPNLTVDSEWVGSGVFIDPSAVQFFGAGKDVVGRSELTAEEAIPRRGGVAVLYPEDDFGGTPIPTVCLIRDVSLTINENINVDAGYEGCGLFQDDDPTKGAVAGELISEGQTVDFEFTIVADSDIIQDMTLHERIKTGLEFSLDWTFTGSIIAGTTPHSAVFKLNRAVISSHEWVAIEGGQQGIRIQCQPLASGNIMPLTLELTTDVADFATYIAPA